MPVVIVTGANGQLGKSLQDIAPLYPSVQFHFFNRENLPLDDFEKIQSTVESIRPNAIINAAAYTAVDKAESERERTFLINGDSVGNLAAAACKVGARFIHVSTDYVFNGEGSVPYQETDPVSPVNSYGASKLRGEVMALEANANTAIVRTSWVYCQHGNNFVKTMIRLMKERESIGVVNDQTGCPTYAIDLAEALLSIILSIQFQPGIFHFSNSGPITWYQFAAAIKELSGSKCTVNPIASSAFPTPAKRPFYSVMDNKKIRANYGIEQKPWRDSLQKCLKELL